MHYVNLLIVSNKTLISYYKVHNDAMMQLCYLCIELTHIFYPK